VSWGGTLAERPQPRGFDVNQPGSTRETFTGLAQGATTDLVGSVVDLGAAATGIASQVDPRLLSMSPKAALLSYLNPFAEQAQEVAGSEALGQRVFGDAPTEELQKIRDDARLVGGVVGLGEMLTAKGAKAVAGGIEDFMQFLPNVRAQAVTPEGSMLPLPDDTLPDTSITKMSADTPGAALRSVQTFAKGIKGGEALIETTPNRILFPDLKFSEVTLRESNIEPGAVDIELLRAGKKGEGLGSQTLKRITDRADETGTTLTLYPASYGDGGLEEAELIEFYQRNGFEFKFLDPDNPDPILDMIREPRPTAPKAFGGLTVRDDVPNFSSISASLNNYEIVPNIQDISMKDIPFPEKENLFYASNDFKRVEDLASQIKESQEINPLIVVQDKEGFYVLEGAHRLAALNELGVSSFPAVVVRDLDELPPVNKAEGGIVSLLDVARNTGRGPRGVSSLAPVARNMNRPMVS
jgi:GNAT superfamily N-acetyltransferase